MTDSDATVFLVDDDPSVVKGLDRLLRAAGFSVRGFTSSEAFLEQHDPAIPGCAVLDLSMPILGPQGDAIAIRPIGILAQSFDHRAFDGAYSAAFLRKVKQVLEQRRWLGELN